MIVQTNIADADIFYVDPEAIRGIEARRRQREDRIDTYPLDALRKAIAPETIACHEAGHVVVYEAVGIPCFKLQVFDQNQAERLGCFGWTFVPTYPAPYDQYPTDVLRAHACGWLGGFAAEIALLEDRPLAETSCAPELEGLETCLAIAGVLDQFEEFLANAQRALQEYHGVHTALTKRLLDRRRLKRTDVSKIVAPIRRTVKQFDVTSWNPPMTPQTSRSFAYVSGGMVLSIPDAALRAA